MLTVQVEGNGPAWAMRLIRHTMAEADVDDGGSPLTHVTVHWEERPRFLHSDGLSYNEPFDTIEIHAGGSHKDRVWVVLHECAHVIVGTGHGHNKHFFRYAYPLYLKHGIQPAYFIWRDAYYIDALNVADEMGYTRITGRLRNMRERYLRNFTKYSQENAQVQDDMKGFKLIGKLLLPQGDNDARTDQS
jgi:hypothetical protein